MKKISVTITTVVVLLCLIGVAVLAVFAQPLAEWYMTFRGLPEHLATAIAAAYYGCTLPAGAALVCLLMLLMNIRRHDMFSARNSQLMAIVSWCCIAIAVICAVASYWYIPMMLVSAIMVFLFLIVRVVRGCFVAATEIREDQDLTI